MRAASFAAAILVAAVTVGAAQKPTIEVRKVRTLVDRDGGSFTRAPAAITALSGGNFALMEVNELPMVVDSTGRLIKRFVRGGGPGEFEFTASGFATGPGDTLYAGNQQSINVYGPDLKFVRAILLAGIYGGNLVPLKDGFVIASQKTDPPAHRLSVHVVSPAGTILRSFVRDTLDRRAWPPPSYRVALASDGGLWVASVYKHRVEKWTMKGQRTGVIDTVPAWFPRAQSGMDGFSTILGISEAGGILWVMINVPVADYGKRMLAVMGGVGREVDSRKVPTEQLSTGRLEAIDVRSGRVIAELDLKAYGVRILNGSQFVIYTPGPNDEAQLEIWEMKLKR
jgi:hypothetical protein